MNFYKCDSTKKYNPEDYNVYLWDDLLDYIDRSISGDMPGALVYQSLLRYSDTFISKEDVKLLETFFKHLIDFNVISSYEEFDDALSCLENLVNFLDSTLVSDLDVIVVGD